MTVTVALPYFGAPRYVEQAVRSILAQTHSDLQLVVIGDGQQPPLPRIADSRLEVYHLPVNRGAYFGLQLVLTASPHEWFAPHAADDWSEPDHLERLLTHAHPAVATGAMFWHRPGRLPYIKRKAFGWEVGLFSRDRLLSIGGYNPAERLSQDFVLIKILRMTGEVVVTDHPTYHRRRWSGALTRNRATNGRSKARLETRARNRPILHECERLASAEAIGAYRASVVPQPIADELAEHAERLRALL